MGIVEHVANWITAVMGATGYPGLVLMMALESMVAPVPSEIVMPFAGFLVAQGRFTTLGAVVASSLGTWIGSIASYYMGRWGGYALVLRWGRFLLLDRHHLEMTVGWFEKRGEITIFVARFIPVVRHFISIPAGVGRMDLWKFSLYTVVGGTIWNAILLFAGIKLQERWELIHDYTREIDYAVAALLLLCGGWWVWRRLRRRPAGP